MAKYVRKDIFFQAQYFAPNLVFFGNSTINIQRGERAVRGNCSLEKVAFAEWDPFNADNNMARYNVCSIFTSASCKIIL